MGQGDRDIFKADLDDGYTKIANLILEALAMCRISGVQKGICLFLFRRTYGWGKAEDAISLGEYAAACGTSEAYISRQIKDLLAKSIIIRVSYIPGKTPVYTFNTRVAEWDKGCINVQGLHECACRGLYECARVGLSDCARVNQEQTPNSPPVRHGGKKGKKKKETSSTPDLTPYKKIVEMYHEHCPSLPKVIVISTARKTHIKARWDQHHQEIAVFEKLFSKVQASNFLKGQNDRNWQADFDWLINETNMAKVLEDKYINKDPITTGPAPTPKARQPDSKQTYETFVPPDR